ncbi:MAG: sodium:proton exchanger [Epsilonproteobacteria bacterium]|nr:sodium:proton exchanger [Campylobacterota bacterium]
MRGYSIVWTTIFAIIAIGSISVTISEIAEILAHRFGEPFGSLILTFSAVAVEILLLFMVLLEATHNPQAVVAVKNGIISTFIVDLNALLGLAMFIGGLNYKEQTHNEDTSSSYTTVLFVSSAMLLVPSTLSVGHHSTTDVFHASIAISVLLLIFYIFIFKFQTTTHTDFFRSSVRSRIFRANYTVVQEEHNYFFDKRSNITNGVFLVLLLGFVGILSEVFAKDGILVLKDFGFSAGFAGIVIALITVAPELFTAIKAAKNNQIQRVVNIAMGASTVSILITVPIVLFLGIMFGINISMDFTPLQIGALIITIILAWKTTDNGETNYLEGLSHIMLFLSYVVIEMFY